MGNLRLFIAFLIAIVICIAPCLQANESDENGYLVNPPIYFQSDPDFPLAGMAAEIPKPGETLPGVDIINVESDGFNDNGVNVQPFLSVQETNVRIGALHGFNNKWAAGLSLPWSRNKVIGSIGGQPASGIAEGIGDILLLVKKGLIKSDSESSLVAAAGIELPTGKDDSVFAQDNDVTNGYYSNSSQRMPISWQPGSGSVDGYLALSYRRNNGRVSYMGIIATKLHTPAFEDAKIGDIFVTGISGTYGITKRIAAALSLVLRAQANDSYPQAPPPGVNQTALAGTTTHGTILYLDPSVRYNIAGRVTIGLDAKIPVVKPDNGFVPQTRLSVIFFPSM